ncbi:alpha/beta hydrolase-fold protein [Sphingomonas sp. LB-2]|uniref:alpha/beta hydrolase n=1 Tax=Sphingomonas caeni TaxID=2984949 RepID=UPI00222FE3B3|nr:alpha/beta hydrolase-fold protein [Sphingomonas caeni]MCW3846075.1 alpha/beta hydrolase-fold protein [Sphingomonas caeni]
MATAALLLVAASAAPVTIPVRLQAGLANQSGRLLIFAKRIEPGAKPETAIDTSPFAPQAVAIAGREVEDMRSGGVVTVDGETGSFPTAFSALPAGTYRIQAVLDRNHDYNYGGRGAGDMVSSVVEVTLPGPVPVLELANALPEPPPPAVADRPDLKPVDFTSPALSIFWGRPVHIRGWIALPPGYGKGATFPTVYSTGGFGSNLRYAEQQAAEMSAMMKDGSAPPMIWVYLDESSPTGTHEFADSVNNGPWGKALTTELIPALEKQYRMDSRASGRFLTGHSSGGWATLWLQVRYPKVFGGTWPTSPDPSDFHDFTNVDLYAPNANMYAPAGGQPYPLVRDHGRVISSLQDFARIEAVLGPYGGQFASFDWVFSPKGADGRPMPMFDRATGKVDPFVVSYWRDNYDIANIVARDWKVIGRDLDGKIHLTVGTADTFYLDGPAHRLQAVLDRLGAKSQFRFLPGKTHFDLLERGGDREALMKDFAWEMYAVARPRFKRP